MKPALILALVLLAGCSPTAPTPVPMPQPVEIAPPGVIITPPTPDPLLSDPRFSLSFYRQMAHDGFDHPGALQRLSRWNRAPMIYLRTIDDRGAAVADRLLDQTAAAIINTTSAWTGGAFGVASLQRGTDTREGHAGWLTVKWSTSGVCGTVSGFGVEGMSITMNHRRPECTCGPLVVKHELGHAMGFYHTGGSEDLMNSIVTTCDKNPSDREMFHARVAYTRAIGSAAP